MNNINFTANSNDRTVQGILVITSNDASFLLNESIGGETKVDLYSQDIKDMGNFIAAVIRRLDNENEFESITLTDEEKTFLIKRPTDDATMRVYKKVSDEEVIVTDQPTVTIKDIYNNEHTVAVETLGFEPVDVPNKFLYTKNPTLNLIYQNAVIPHDYNRKMNAVILKEISRNKKIHGDKPWAFWCSTTARIMSQGWNGKAYNAVYVDSDMVRSIEAIVDAQ